MQLTRPDVVVVGGGTAGSVLAARLSEDPHRHVLLVEAGPVSLPQPSTLLDSSVVPGARGSASWAFPGRLAAGRDWTHLRGRVIGGSSTTNGGYFIPAGPTDAAAWSAVGGERWSWAQVRPAQQAIERDLDMPHSPKHGHAGPVVVSRAAADDPLISAFRAAAESFGLATDLDKGADWSDGFGVTPSNRLGDIRFNAAMSHLLPARTRPNLEILGDTTVLWVTMSGRRATGVVALNAHGVVEIDAGEVILASGAVRSADLLALSGVALPDLGTGLHDDAQLILEVAGWPATDERNTWLGGVAHATLPDGSTVEVLQSLHSLRRIGGGDPDPGAPTALFVSVQTPGPPGRLVRDSSDPMRLPRVEFDYLSTDAARRQLRDALRFATELVRAGGGVVSALDRRTLDVDRVLDAWIHAHIGTSFHTTGGCAIGTVADAAGRVLDTEGLRVADLSVLPTAPHRGPAATAFLVGELLSGT